MAFVEHVKWELISGRSHPRRGWSPPRDSNVCGLLFCFLWKVVPRGHGEGCSSALILRDVPSIYLEGQVSLLKSNPKRDHRASKTKSHQWLSLPLGWTTVSLKLTFLVDKVLRVLTSHQAWKLSPNGRNSCSSDQTNLSPQASSLHFTSFAQAVFSKNSVYLVNTKCSRLNFRTISTRRSLVPSLTDPWWGDVEQFL